MANDNLHHHPAALPPMPAVARILSQFDRRKLEGFIIVAIGLLDVMDGDPDREDATGEDDAFEDHNERLGYYGPGCPVSDIDKGIDDDPHDDDDPREDENDREIETWSHPDDHPAELFLGTPHHTDGPEAA